MNSKYDPVQYKTGVTAAHPDGKSINNPGNILGGGSTKFEGETGDTNGYRCFDNITNGYRAIMVQVMTDFDIHELTTLGEIIQSYSGLSKGVELTNYENYVCNYISISPVQVLSREQLLLWLEQIALQIGNFEQGWHVDEGAQLFQFAINEAGQNVRQKFA